jgi:hypothetical protein
VPVPDTLRERGAVAVPGRERLRQAAPYARSRASNDSSQASAPPYCAMT